MHIVSNPDAPTHHPHTPPTTKIRPVAGWALPDAGQLWAHRNLLKLLVLRNVRVTYQQTAVGITWAIIRPVLTTAILWLVFGGLADRLEAGDGDAVPYPLHVLAGLTLWTLFSQSLTGICESVVNQADLLTKVYFPRLILPLASVGTAMVDFAIQALLTLLLIAVSGHLAWTHLWALPVFVSATLGLTFSVGVWLTALNVQFRDVRHIVPFLLQSLFYLTPIIYPVSLLPSSVASLLQYNPLFAVVAGFRWSLVGGPSPNWMAFGISMIPVVALSVFGLVYFRRMEATFADVI